MRFKISASHISVWQNDKRENLVKQSKDKVGIFYVEEDNWLGSWIEFPLPSSFILEFEGISFSKRTILNENFVEVYVENKSLLNQLAFQLTDWFTILNSEKTKEENPIDLFLKDKEKELYSLFDEVKKKLEKAEKTMSLEEIKEIQWHSDNKILSEYLSSFRNKLWPKIYLERFSKKKMYTELDKLLKSMNIKNLFRVAGLREVKIISEQALSIAEDYEDIKTKNDIRNLGKLLKSSESTRDRLNEWKKMTEKSIGHEKWINEDYAKVSKPIIDIITNLKQEISILEKKEEERLREEEEEKQVLDQLRSLDSGIQISIDRLSEICSLNKESIMRIINNLLKKNPDLGKYYEKQQVFLPGSSLISEIDKLFKMFEKSTDKKK